MLSVSVQKKPRLSSHLLHMLCYIITCLGLWSENRERGTVSSHFLFVVGTLTAYLHGFQPLGTCRWDGMGCQKLTKGVFQKHQGCLYDVWRVLLRILETRSLDPAVL